ncbi:MAG: DNA alkylation repair protein [Pedobacter sp.]|uniref:DNA alkylation repair protein n=1 Tax=Pedobacter sp. TaxID=1411316 RepID=UPI003563C5B4
MDNLLSRKGASKPEHIPKEVLVELNKGTLESVNLTEWLAVDHIELIENVLAGYPYFLNFVKREIERLESPSVKTLIVEIGTALLLATHENRDQGLFNYLASHHSDSVRCWAVYMVGLDKSLDIHSKFIAIRPFAADRHFGVRELAWMAMRNDIDENLSESIRILVEWTVSDDENIRRFSTEATRPCGVWCKHIALLKDKPEIALALLEPLKSDTSAYVQLSVGNWLNDAGKSKPEWVTKLCNSWVENNKNENTLKIVKRATRNIT